MDQNFAITLDDTSVRFTPEGKVSILDALQALFDTEQPAAIWSHVTQDHPEILDACDEYSFDQVTYLPVTGSKGWVKLWRLLPDYLTAQ